MTPESSRFGMTPTFQESMRKDQAKKSKAESRALEAEMETRHSPTKFEGPQIFSREQFGIESGKWLNKLNQAQSELMEEIRKRAYLKGENVDALETQAALLKSWSDRVWALSLENAHQGLTDPNGVVSVDQELLHAIEGDPMTALGARLQRDAFPEQLEASARGLEASDVDRATERIAREHQENREKQMSREIAGMREKMDTLEDQMRVIQNMRRDIDEHEDKLIESGEFSTEKLTPLDIERSELEKLHARFFDEIKNVMKNFTKLLDAYETFQSENPFAKAS